jgi:hypothetical protein
MTVAYIWLMYVGTVPVRSSLDRGIKLHSSLPLFSLMMPLLCTSVRTHRWLNIWGETETEVTEMQNSRGDKPTLSNAKPTLSIAKPTESLG